jgi:hypothetical protein
MCTRHWRNHTANSSSCVVVAQPRSSCIRRPGRCSCGTRTHASRPALPGLAPRSVPPPVRQSSTSSILNILPRNRSHSGGRRQEPIGDGNRVGPSCSWQQCAAPPFGSPGSHSFTGSPAPRTTDLGERPPHPNFPRMRERPRRGPHDSFLDVASDLIPPSRRDVSGHTSPTIDQAKPGRPRTLPLTRSRPRLSPTKVPVR